MRNRVVAICVITSTAALGLVRDVSAQSDASRAEIADLVDDLRDPDAHVREVARKQIIALGDKAVAPLVALLKSGEPRGRAEAVGVLAAMGPAAREAAPAIAEGATFATGAARLPFLRALAEIDPVGSAGKAVPILLAFLEDRDPAVRLDAAKAMRSFGVAAARFAPDVLARISSADPPVRNALLEALRAMGVDAAQSVVDLYAERGEADRVWLSSVIAEMGESIVPAALSRLASDDKAVRASAAQVLGAAGDGARGATLQLVAALKDPAGVVRRRAAEALGAVGADAKVAIPALAAVLNDPASRAQLEAAIALGRVATPSGSAAGDASPNAPEIDRAVDGGLDWLVRHQSPDGHWDSAGFGETCKPGRCDGAGETQYNVGVSALATLAFLGAGETHRVGRHAASVFGGLKYLRDVQDSDGCFGTRTSQHWVYSHATATLAMTEAYRRTAGGGRIFMAPAQRGLQFIQKAQNPYLAWRYNFPPDGDNDTSVTGWMTSALAAGGRAGLEVDPGALRGALTWVDKMTEPEFGRTGYQQRGGPPARTNETMSRFPAEKSESLTAEALAVRLDAGQDPKTNADVLKSAALLGKCAPRWDASGGSVDFCYWRFGAQAMHRIDGPSWDVWRASLVAAVLPHQAGPGAGCVRGSWAPDDPWGASGGRVYSTSMAVLALEECGSFERGPATVKKRPTTPEVRTAMWSLAKALDSDDDAVKNAAKSALDAINAVFHDETTAPK